MIMKQPTNGAVTPGGPGWGPGSLRPARLQLRRLLRRRHCHVHWRPADRSAVTVPTDSDSNAGLDSVKLEQIILLAGFVLWQFQNEGLLADICRCRGNLKTMELESESQFKVPWLPCPLWTRSIVRRSLSAGDDRVGVRRKKTMQSRLVKNRSCLS
jgi:hypothetical protein